MISFRVNGEPVGKGRPKFSRRGDYVHAYTPKKTSDYEEKILFEFLASNCEEMPVYGKGIPVKVELEIAFPIPQSYTKKRQARCRMGIEVPTKKPDVDNVIKMLDALNGYAWHDDSQITEIVARKIYADEPYLDVRIHPRDWE